MTYSKTKNQKLGSSKRDKLRISKISHSRKKIFYNKEFLVLTLVLPWCIKLGVFLLASKEFMH